VRVRLEWGTEHSGVDYALARQLGREWRQALEALFRDRVDVLALPTVPVPSHRLEGSEGPSAARELLRFTYPFSLSGLPALSTPCGFTTEGFPVGVQLVAAGEAVLTQVAHAYQQITGWHRQPPAL
jgi:aspartyl-tRNA(Asn)/glutamyl-tRNA(Gln) amidotransferase subunit A